MASGILGIYEAVADMPVQAANFTPRVYNIDRVPQSLSSADCPARLLLPLGTTGENRSTTFQSVGRLMAVSWKITDLLLFKPLGQGGGVHTVAFDLIDYMRAYIDAVKANRALGTGTLVSLNFDAGIFTFPLGGKNIYYGVETTLVINENGV